jgi:hypothetical protein
MLDGSHAALRPTHLGPRWIPGDVGPNRPATALLAASPWLFGFADGSANVWVPHMVVGLAAIFLGLTTVQQDGYSYRNASAAR